MLKDGASFLVPDVVPRCTKTIEVEDPSFTQETCNLGLAVFGQGPSFAATVKASSSSKAHYFEKRAPGSPRKVAVGTQGVGLRMKGVV